ncbi:1-acyl-sn-glycerol-3-phosphate acyltransferase [Salinarimonas rosea]|uniref:1-acyl-sn-glycerol-3-phosphate acyltransferase n=1 Tax=Salinarimonas rosea TaxID=552063 RepID=UPI0012EC4090|nr:1-acyl-sn-glycerol-3-phosphate acyltransferase [Salinarimonas rosea]
MKLMSRTQARLQALVGRVDTRSDAQKIVDALIAERGQKIMEAWWWPAAKPLVEGVLRYPEAVRMAETIAPLQADAVFEHLSQRLKLDVRTANADRLPATGKVVIVSNHPTGIADGVALWDAVKSRRRDLSIFANRDAIRLNPRLADIIVPVEWRSAFKTREKTRETIRLSTRAFDDERAVVLFPSGRLAYWNDDEKRLCERPWMSSALALARRYDAPIVPIHMGARNSGLFHFLARVSTELRDMTVFYELLNKTGRRFDIHFGKPIAPETLEGRDVQVLTERMRAHCFETLARDPDADFAP